MINETSDLINNNTEGNIPEQLQDMQRQLQGMDVKEIGQLYYKQAVISDTIGFMRHNGEEISAELLRQLQGMGIEEIQQVFDRHEKISNMIELSKKITEGDMTKQQLQDMQRQLRSMSLEQIEQQYMQHAIPYTIEMFDENTIGLPFDEVQDMRKKLEAMNNVKEIKQVYDKQVYISSTIALRNGQEPDQQWLQNLQAMDIKQIEHEFGRQHHITDMTTLIRKNGQVPDPQWLQELRDMSIEELWRNREAVFDIYQKK